MPVEHVLSHRAGTAGRRRVFLEIFELLQDSLGSHRRSSDPEKRGRERAREEFQREKWKLDEINKEEENNGDKFTEPLND